MKKTDKASNKLFEGLTKNQADAVRRWNEDLEIIASAGSGKTKTITHRILNMIANGVKPENIVAITFTKKAAAEMKARIYKLGEDLLGSTKGFAAMFIGTIDSWCFKTLQDLNSEYTKFSVLDDIQTKIFLERYEKESGFEESRADQANNLNYSYNFENGTYDKDEKYDRKLDLHFALMSTLNNTWYNRDYRKNWTTDHQLQLYKYNKCLRDEKYFDFSGLIRDMIESLDPDSDTNNGTMSDFGRNVFDKTKYITVDEYQDTNPAQEYLLSLFKKHAGTKICVVGDPDQTIYQFRGSYEGNILSFYKNNQCKCIHLNENFRSTKAVIDIADHFISKIHSDDPEYTHMIQGHISGRALDYEDGDTVWAGFEDYDKEAEFVSEQIIKLHEAGIPYKEMAVLFRTRYEKDYGIIMIDFQEKIAEKLHAKGIPYTVECLNHLYTKNEYKACCAVFDFLYEKYAHLYETEECGRVFGYINYPDTNVIEEEEITKLENMWIGLHPSIDKNCVHNAVKKISELNLNDMKFGNQFNMQQIFQDFISELPVFQAEDEASENILYNLGIFSKLIADFELLFFKESPSFKLYKFKKHMEHVADKLYPEGKETNSYIHSDSVRIMTVHQSKGLEFTAVFIPTLCKETFPTKSFINKSDKVYSLTDLLSENEIPNYNNYLSSDLSERKIYYVALTRSKKYLFLTYAFNYGGIEKEKSDFLTDSDSSFLKPFDNNIRYSCDHLPETNDSPAPIELNFSLLSNYFDCPYRFKLSNLYGFVQPYVSEQGYGRMLHEIMMHIHRAWIDGKDLSEEDLDTIAEDSLYLPFANKKQLEKSLKGAKACAKAYVNQNKKDKDKIEAAEMDINIEMGDGVSVNGRIDLVKRIDEDGTMKTAIVDLKSAGKDAEQCLNEEQLKIYAIGYEEMTGRPADYMVVYNLDKPDGSANSEERVCRDILEKTKTDILQAANCIRRSNLPRIRSDKCSKCYTRHLCSKQKN